MPQTVAPLMLIGSTSLLAISTLTSEINFYTRLIRLKDPETRCPMFTVLQIQLACEACKEAGKSSECVHLLHLVPRWQSSDKHRKLKTIMQDRPDLIESELSGLAFDSGWSTLVLKPAFIAFAQNLALAQTGDGRDATPLVAGEPLRLATPADKNIEVQSLGGSPLDWNGLAAQLPTLPRAGVYVIRSAGGTNRVAVRSSEKEGRQNFVTGDRLPALGTLAYAVNDYHDGPTLASEFHRLEKSLDLSPLLLLLALLALAAEGLLANPPPMRARPAANPQADLKEETSGIR